MSQEQNTSQPQPLGGGHQSQKVRPIITPDAFNGEASSNWDEWIGHFKSVARVNEWDEANRLLWLEVRMTGKAQSAWRRISNEAKGHYDTAKDALWKRFEPDSRRELYAVEFQTRKRHRGEAWEELGDNLRLLADKAFPDLEDKAKEQLSLDRFLTLLDKPALALSVKQKRPRNIDEAVSYTLEIELYMMTTCPASRPVSVAEVTQKEQTDVDANTQETVETIAAVQTKQDAILSALRDLTLRLDRLEQKVANGEKQRGYQPQSKRVSQDRPRDPIVCRRCGREGHFARGCAADRTGND